MKATPGAIHFLRPADFTFLKNWETTNQDRSAKRFALNFFSWLLSELILSLLEH